MHNGIWSGPGNAVYGMQARLPEAAVYHVQGSNNQFASALGQLLYTNSSCHVGDTTAPAALPSIAASSYSGGPPAQPIDANAVILALLQQQQKIAQLESINKQLSVAGLLPHASMTAPPPSAHVTVEPRSAVLMHTQYPALVQQQHHPQTFQLLVQPQQVTNQHAASNTPNLAALLSGMVQVQAAPLAQAQAPVPPPSSAFHRPGGQSGVTLMQPVTIQVVKGEAGAPVRQHSSTSSTGNWAQAQPSPPQQQVRQDSELEGSQHACTALMALAQACDQDAAAGAGGVAQQVQRNNPATAMAAPGAEAVMPSSMPLPAHSDRNPLWPHDGGAQASPDTSTSLQAGTMMKLVKNAAAAQLLRSSTAGTFGHHASQAAYAATAGQNVRSDVQPRDGDDAFAAWYPPPQQQQAQPRVLQQQRKRQRHTPYTTADMSSPQAADKSDAQHPDDVGASGGSRKRAAVAADPFTFTGTTVFKGAGALSDADAQYLLFSWSMAELQALLHLVNELGDNSWEEVAGRLNARFSVALRSTSSLTYEDSLLLGEALAHQRRPSHNKGPGERSPQECRERWALHVTPAGRKEGWSLAEEIILVEAHKAVGNKWSEISKLLKGRADNTVKNHYNTALRRKHPGRTWNFVCSLLDAYQVSMGLKSFPNGAREQQLKQLYTAFTSGTDVCIPPLPPSAVLQLEELYRRHQTTHHLTGYGTSMSISTTKLVTSQLLQDQIKRVHSGGQHHKAESTGSPCGLGSAQSSQAELPSSPGPPSPASASAATAVDCTHPATASGSYPGSPPALAPHPLGAAKTGTLVSGSTAPGEIAGADAHPSAALDHHQPAGVVPDSTPTHQPPVQSYMAVQEVAAVAPAGCQHQSSSGAGFVCRVVEEVKQVVQGLGLGRPLVPSTGHHALLPTAAPATVPLPV